MSMMAFFTALVLSVILALVMVGLWSYRSPRNDWRGLLPVGVLATFVILAGGLWMAPVGPPISEVFWMPFVMMAIFFALLWTVLSSIPGPPKVPGERVALPPERRGDGALAGTVFWTLILGLAVAVLVRLA
jgi:hypothetical protein